MGVGGRARRRGAIGLALAVVAAASLVALGEQPVEAHEVLGQSPDRVFSPDGDGQEDVLPVWFQLSEPSQAAVVVRGADGATVRWLVPLVPGTPVARVDVTWDGTDAGGAVVADGAYDIVLLAVDGGGDLLSASVRTAVRTDEPVTWAAPAHGSVVSGPVDMVVTPRPGVVIDDVIFVGQASPLPGFPAADGSWWRPLSDRVFGYGERTISALVQWYDELGALHTGYQTPPVTVTLPGPPAVAAGIGGVVEGDDGVVALEVPVRLSAPSGLAGVGARWSTVDAGEPTPGLDYVAASGWVWFAPGETEVVITIDVLGDLLDEPGQLWGAEWLAIQLEHPRNAVLGSGPLASIGLGLIVDDD